MKKMKTDLFTWFMLRKRPLVLELFSLQTKTVCKSCFTCNSDMYVTYL